MSLDKEFRTEYEKNKEHMVSNVDTISHDDFVELIRRQDWLLQKLYNAEMERE